MGRLLPFTPFLLGDSPFRSVSAWACSVSLRLALGRPALICFGVRMQASVTAVNFRFALGTIVYAFETETNYNSSY